MLRQRKTLPTPQGLITAEKAGTIGAEHWDLRLYVAGPTPRSIMAFSNLKRICEQHLAGHYRIELIDVLQDPRLARRDQVIALPTVVCRQPGPSRRVTGDLSDTAHILAELNLPVRT